MSNFSEVLGKALKLDMSLYRQSGEGANGASYDCIDDPTIMVKLYNPSYDIDTILLEQELARKVYDLGIPSPEPGELVTDGSRIGIRFRRIVGKRSFSRALADEPERTEVYGREFARACKKLHAVECPSGTFPDAKQQFLDLLKADKIYSAAEKEKMAGFILALPDGKTVLHGDMHIGNLLTTLPKGAPVDAAHDLYWIDLGYFARGYSLIDLGMLQNICLFADEEFRYHDMHVHGDLTAELWKYFVDEYFFAEDKLAERYFGPGQSFESVNSLLKPFCAMKLLLVEYNLGFLPENYIPVFRGALEYM